MSTTWQGYHGALNLLNILNTLKHTGNFSLILQMGKREWWGWFAPNDTNTSWESERSSILLVVFEKLQDAFSQIQK